MHANTALAAEVFTFHRKTEDQHKNSLKSPDEAAW